MDTRLFLSRAAVILFAGIFGLFALFMFLAKNGPPPSSKVENIAEGCKREYGYSKTDVTPAEFECTVRALNRLVRDRAKMDRVYRSTY